MASEKISSLNLLINALGRYSICLLILNSCLVGHLCNDSHKFSPRILTWGFYYLLGCEVR
jgi:hypothetical protein